MRLLKIVCDLCDEESPVMEVCAVPGGASAAREALVILIERRGWKSTGLGRHVCPRCLLHGRLVADGEWMRRTARPGFTLVELLVVMAILAIVLVAAAAVLGVGGRRATLAAAQLVQGEMAAAVARAQRDGAAGIRLVPDPAFPIARLADGSVDPSRPLAYSRVVPLVRPPAIRDGRVAVHAAFPAGFTPPSGVLILEQEVARTEGGLRLRNEPTAWAWRVRLGDRVELGTGVYTVCGPVAQANPEGYVTYPPSGTGLDRGDGPAEWLMLVNGLDDDGDGSVDNGFNGRDDNLDGVVDDPMEWTETERWGAVGTVSDAPYAIRPRPAPPAGVGGVDLGGAVVDATGWDAASPTRSRLPVDRRSGCVDLVVYADGRVEPPSRYAPTVPAVGGLGRPFLHFWICDRGSVGAAEPETGAIVSVNARTGLAASGEADPADPAGTFRAAEGGRP